MYDVFISHSSLDKKSFVEPLVDELIRLGLQVWYDKHNIHKGDKIKDSILNGITESVVFVAVVSANYYQSNWANLELGMLQANFPDNFLPIIFPDIKELTGQRYPFLLNHNYMLKNNSIPEIAHELKKVVFEKRQERGLWHVEKTNLRALTREIYGYNNFKLDQIAIRISHIFKNLNTDLLLTLNEIELVLNIVFSDVAIIENVFIDSGASALDVFSEIDFLSQNLKEHLKYLKKIYQEQVRSFHQCKSIVQEDLYLVQFSLYSIIEWYMITYYKKPSLKQKKLVAVMPEDFTSEDILESYRIETLVLPPDLIASPSTDLEWFNYNPLIMIGARDVETGKLVGFFTTLPVNDDLYKQIKSGNFDDTKISINDIRQYDIPGFYKLYLCSFCIHPAYNTTSAFKIIYTSFIDFLLNLACDREIYISDIIADGVTLKGTNLCESIGMKKVTTSIHKSNVYAASLIPPAFTTLKLNNKIGHKLMVYYQRMYDEYKEIF